jgi:MFS family permease
LGSSSTRKYKYLILIICIAIFSLFHAGRQVLPPSLPLVKEEFNLTYFTTSFVAISYYLGYAATLILGSYLALIFGNKRIITFGLLWFSLTLFPTTSTGYIEHLMIIRILTGAAFGMFYTSGISITSSLFPKMKGGVIGLYTGLGAGIGRFVPPFFASIFLVSVGWRPFFVILAIPSIFMALIFWSFINKTY